MIQYDHIGCFHKSPFQVLISLFAHATLACFPSAGKSGRYCSSITGEVRCARETFDVTYSFKQIISSFT